MTPRMQFPPSSLDLNVLDYAIFAYLQENVYKKPYNPVYALLKAIKFSLNEITLECVKMVCSRFRHQAYAPTCV